MHKRDRRATLTKTPKLSNDKALRLNKKALMVPTLIFQTRDRNDFLFSSAKSNPRLVKLQDLFIQKTPSVTFWLISHLH